MAQAKGNFEVTVTPASEDKGMGSTLGRMTLEKIFHGDITGTSKGEMLTVGTDAGPAVYVAVERISGTLQGKQGSFALVHQGIARPDSQELTIFVAPGSGSGELAGLEGKMTLDLSGGGHAYVFEYTIAPSS